jgi:hypothetical protein
MIKLGWRANHPFHGTASCASTWARCSAVTGWEKLSRIIIALSEVRAG